MIYNIIFKHECSPHHLQRVKHCALWSYQSPYFCWNIICIFREVLLPMCISASTSAWQISASLDETRFYLFCENLLILPARIYSPLYVLIIFFHLVFYSFMHSKSIHSVKVIDALLCAKYANKKSTAPFFKGLRWGRLEMS